MKAKIEKKIEMIKRQDPFRRVMRIEEVESLYSDSARSGDVFKIISVQGKIYKMRYCNSLWEAWRIEKNAKRYPECFPEFYGREGRYVLFEWIDGPELPKSAPLSVFKELGGIYGKMHTIEEEHPPKKDHRKFRKAVKTILENNIIKKDDAEKLIDIYKKKLSNLNTVVVMELSDIHLGNAKLDPKKGKVVIIDEEGCMHRIKGVGMYKAFVKWFNDDQKKAFLEGYKSVHSDDYITDEYADFLTFWVIVKDVANKASSGRSYDKPLKKLKEFLEKN